MKTMELAVFLLLLLCVVSSVCQTDADDMFEALRASLDENIVDATVRWRVWSDVLVRILFACVRVRCVCV